MLVIGRLYRYGFINRTIKFTPLGDLISNQATLFSTKDERTTVAGDETKYSDTGHIPMDTFMSDTPAEAAFSSVE